MFEVRGCYKSLNWIHKSNRSSTAVHPFPPIMVASPIQPNTGKSQSSTHSFDVKMGAEKNGGSEAVVATDASYDPDFVRRTL